MRWKTTNLHLQKGNKLAVYRDSALFLNTKRHYLLFKNIGKILF